MVQPTSMEAAPAAPADSASIAWRREVGPSIFASPLIVGDAVVVATGDGRLTTFAARTGERRWSRRLDSPLRALALRDSLVITAADRENGRAFALRVRDGGPLWTRHLGRIRHAPTVTGDTVFIAAEDRVAALDAASGTTLWETVLSGRVAAPPVPFGDQLLLVAPGDTLLHLDRATGTRLAWTPLPGTVSAPPVVRGREMLLPLYPGRLVAYDVARRDLAWSTDFDAPILAAPAHTAQGDVYLLTRTAELWRLPAGRSEPQRVADLEGAAVGSLTTAGNYVIVGRLDGQLFALRPDGTVAWRHRLDDAIVAPVTVGDGALYVPLLRGTLVKITDVQ